MKKQIKKSYLKNVDLKRKRIKFEIIRRKKKTNHKR